MNEYSQITEVAIRSPLQSFIDEEKISSEWESLREKFETNGRGAWKKWLSKEYGASFELGDIKRATEKLDHIPKEFFDLLQLLKSLPMRVKKISE